MSEQNVTYLLEGHPYFCVRKKWKKRYCVVIKRSSFSNALKLYIAKPNSNFFYKTEIIHSFDFGVHCLSRLSLLLICTSSVFCLTFDDFDELQQWAETLEHSLIRCRFFATACYAAKGSQLRVHMTHPIDRLSFTFSAPGLNRSLPKLRTSFEGVRRSSLSSSLQSLRALFHRRHSLHSPDITKHGVVGEEAFCDGCLHVTHDRICFVRMPSDRQPALLASWLFDSGDLLAYGTGRFAMPLSPFTPNQQLAPEAVKSCRLAFYLLSSIRMRHAPGLHIFVCDQAAEVSRWIQRATRPTCLLHEWRWMTSIVSQLGSQNLRSSLSPSSWRHRCFSDPVASTSNDQSRAWTTLDSSRNAQQYDSNNDPWRQPQTPSVMQDSLDDRGDCLTTAARNLPTGFRYPKDPAENNERLLLPPTRSNSSLFGELQRPASSAKEACVGHPNNNCHTDTVSLHNLLRRPSASQRWTQTSTSRPCNYGGHDSTDLAATTHPDQPCAIESGRQATASLPSTSFTPSQPPNASQQSPRNPGEVYRRTDNYPQPPTLRRPQLCRFSAPVSSPDPSTHTFSPGSRSRAISESFATSATRSSNYRHLLSPSTLSSLGELSIDQLTQVCSSACWEAAPLTAKPHTGHLYVSREEVLQAAGRRTKDGRSDASGDCGGGGGGGRPSAGGGGGDDDGSETAMRSLPHRGLGDPSSYIGSISHRQRRSAPGRDPLQSAIESEAVGPLPTSSVTDPSLLPHESRHGPNIQTTAGQSVFPYVNVVVDVITTSAASAVSPPLSMNPPPFVPRSDPENYLRPVLTDVHTVGGYPVPRWSQPVPRFPEYLNVGRTSVADANASYVSQLDGERRSHANAPSLLPRPTALEPPRHSDPSVTRSDDSEKPFASASLSVIPVSQLNYSTLVFSSSNPQQPATETSQGNSLLVDSRGAGSSRPHTMIPRTDEVAASTMVPALIGADRSRSQGCNYVLIDCVSTHALSQMVHELADPPDAHPLDASLLYDVTTPEPAVAQTLTTRETIPHELHRPANRRSTRSRGFCGILLPLLPTETDIELTTFVNPAVCSSGATRASSHSDQFFSLPRHFHLRSRLGRFCLRTTR